MTAGAFAMNRYAAASAEMERRWRADRVNLERQKRTFRTLSRRVGTECATESASVGAHFCQPLGIPATPRVRC